MWRTAPLQARTIGQGLEVKPSTLLGAGRGLFTTVVIPKNEFITSFTGRIIGHKEALKLREQHETGYVIALAPLHSYLDGDREPRKGLGGGQFANHDPKRRN